MNFLEILHRTQLTDNATRMNAEEALTMGVEVNPSQAALELLQIASNVELNIAIRQSALLNLKRIVPLHWSAGFSSFKGAAISQDAKATVRSALIQLVVSDPDSKIRNGASYCVVQIAAVDYPDEWPELLNILYSELISSNSIAVLGALSLLQELFDDLVSEEQFFQGGVGFATISECLRLLSDDNSSDEVKRETANLYKICLLQLQNPEILEDPAKIPQLQSHFREVFGIFNVILQNIDMHIDTILLRSVIYSILYIFSTEFPEELVSVKQDQEDSLQKNLIDDIISTSQVYLEIVVLENEDKYTSNKDPEISINHSLNNLLIEQFSLLGTVKKTFLSSSPTEYFLDSILASCYITLESESLWLENFNEFVSFETEVSADFVARNVIFDYVSELKVKDASYLFNWCTEKLMAIDADDDWRSKEALLYLYGTLLRNQSELQSQISYIDLLNKLISFLQDKEILVRARAILIFPEFLEKFQANLKAQDFGVKSLLESLRAANNDDSLLIKSSFLISLNYYNSFLEFTEIPQESQEIIFQLCDSVLADAEEDTPPLLAESVNLALKIHKTSLRALNLLFEIASRDPANLQLIADIEEALESLLFGVDMQTYVSYLQNSLPQLLATIESSSFSNFEFSSQLSLAIQILNIFIYNSPELLPPPVFNMLNPILSKLLLNASDDQILQLGGDAYNSLIQKAPTEYFEISVVLKILSKYLSPDMSDSAAMNVGSLVISIITKFEVHIKNLLPEILKATTKRLLAAKELSTIEDLLSVLCYMVSINVEQTITFLKQFEITQIFNIWFKYFESLRGDKIKENCIALGSIYASGINFDFTVNGDEAVDQNSNIIITRSMKHQQKFEQVSVPFKIVKLLVFELSSQTQHRELDSVAQFADAGGEEDGWEDVEDISRSYDKLQSYVQVDHSHHDHDSDDTSNEDVKQYLVSFFKKVASNNISNFEASYSKLTDEEKRVLTENIV